MAIVKKYPKQMKEKDMNTKKFKSVAVPADTYEKLRVLAEKEYRSVPMELTRIVKKEVEENLKKSAA